MDVVLDKCVMDRGTVLGKLDQAWWMEVDGTGVDWMESCS